MDNRLKAAQAILDFEARRDKQGNLEVYYLPPNDGGGRFEVAGINERYNNVEAVHLVDLIHAGKYEVAENYACEVIARDTDAAEKWDDDPGVQFYLRDCIFNRGVHGAARMLQWAVGLKGKDTHGVRLDDGIIGPRTRAAIEPLTAAELLIQLRKVREEYEREVVGYRANFWRGLVNRWNKSLTVAQNFDKA